AALPLGNRAVPIRAMILPDGDLPRSMGILRDGWGSCVMDGAKGSDYGTVTLTVPGHPVYLRLARLAAADTGARAGLSIGDLEDLRIAVDELAYALIGD